MHAYDILTILIAVQKKNKNKTKRKYDYNEENHPALSWPTDIARRILTLLGRFQNKIEKYYTCN